MANCDGAEVTIRPIAPGDFAIEKRFIAGLSTTSYRRLLSPRTPQDAEIARCTDIVRTREAARIAVTDADGVGPMCGVARYVRGGKSAARTIVLAVQGRDTGSARRCSSSAGRERRARHRAPLRRDVRGSRRMLHVPCEPGRMSREIDNALTRMTLKR